MINDVLLLTLHSQNNNFGSVLQGLALYKAIENIGCSPTVLDYRPYYSNGAKNTKVAIINALINLVFFPYYISRTLKFGNVINMEKMTPRYKKYDELSIEVGKHDLFLIGSDQVWNDSYLCGQDPAYYLEFLSTGKKASYAASLGRLADDAALKRLAKRIAKFDYISVREEKSAEQLRQYGISAQYVLDPVFLQPVDFYRSLETPHKKRDYILAYIIEKDDFISEVVERIAKCTGKKVIQIGGFAKKCNYDEFPRSAGPRDFLALIDNADFVITSSFHGTAFSLIFRKQFAVAMPSGNTLRLENILHTAGTEERIISDMDDIDEILAHDINYDIVSPQIEKKRAESLQYLYKILGRDEKIC